MNPCCWFTAASKTVTVSVLAVMAIVVSPSASAAERAGSSGTSAYVYVGASLYGGTGSIFGFAVAPDGSAQPVPGSPFSGADGSIVGANSFVFATDGKNIVTYTAATDGSLSQTSSVDGTAYDQDPQYSSVGTLTVPADGRDVYTDNWYVDGANNAYESWAVNSAGQLSYLPTLDGVPLYSTAGGWPLTFTPDGRFAYTWSVCKWDGNVWGLTRLSHGSVQYFNPDARGLSSPTPGYGSECSQGVATSALGYVVAAWNGGYCCGGPTGFANYVVENDGTLDQVPNSQIVANETAMAFDASGRYMALTPGLGIQMYQLQSNGTLAAIGSVVEQSVAFSAFGWDNSDHLYALGNPGTQLCQNQDGACALYIFNSDAGQLSLAPGSPYVLGQAGSLAVLP